MGFSFFIKMSFCQTYPIAPDRQTRPANLHFLGYHGDKMHDQIYDSLPENKWQWWHQHLSKSSENFKQKCSQQLHKKGRAEKRRCWVRQNFSRQPHMLSVHWEQLYKDGGTQKINKNTMYTNKTAAWQTRSQLGSTTGGKILLQIKIIMVCFLKYSQVM